MSYLARRRDLSHAKVSFLRSDEQTGKAGEFGVYDLRINCLSSFDSPFVRPLKR